MLHYSSPQPCLDQSVYFFQTHIESTIAIQKSEGRPRAEALEIWLQQKMVQITAMGAYNYGQVLYGELLALIHETANLSLNISPQSLCNKLPPSNTSGPDRDSRL